MKLIRPVALFFALALILSGCSFDLAASVDNLISPISPGGENSEVQNALSVFCNDSYTLKSPASGEYTTPYIFYDLNSDGENEALAFYEPSGTSGLVNMALIVNDSDNTWNVADNIEGEGADVYSVEFDDLNSDGIEEIIVMWDMISNSTSHIFSCYFQNSDDGEYSLVNSGISLNINNYVCTDIDLDGQNEIITFSIDSANTSSEAVMYRYTDNKLNSIGMTKLDGHISYYSQIKLEEGEDYTYIFADAVSSNVTQSLTEIIKYSDYYKTIISPYYSYSNAITAQTERNFLLTSMDINDDGLIEIPLEADFETSGEVTAVDWRNYNGTMLTHSCYSLAVLSDGYQVVIPDSYIADNLITVKYSSKNSKLTLKDTDNNTVFEIVSVLSTVYQQNQDEYEKYFELYSNSGYVYLAKIGNSENIEIGKDDLTKMIKKTA